MERRHAYRLIGAAEVVVNMSHGTQTLPASERQARPLTVLVPDQQREAWQQAVETAPQGRSQRRMGNTTIGGIVRPEGTQRVTGRSYRTSFSTLMWVDRIPTSIPMHVIATMGAQTEYVID